MKDTWTAYLRCLNCNHRWIEEIKKGFKLAEHNGLIEIPDNLCFMSAEYLAQAKKFICPNCMCKSKVVN